MRIGRLFSMFAMLLAACTTSSGGPGRAPVPSFITHGVLVLGSDSGVVTIDPTSETPVVERPGLPPLGSWTTVYTTEARNGRTVVRGTDPLEGDALSTFSVRGELNVRVASHDGTRIAMMEPLEPGDSPWVPEPRSHTEIVVADPRGVSETQRYSLEGNFEPEAFSTDGRVLYLIRYVPPMDPTGYRVAAMALSDGEVYPVTTPIKGIQVVETMQGTRLEQVAAPDGTMLYTLYTTAPAGYAGDEEASSAGTPHHAGFVHTLDLDEGWAHCVSLPQGMWESDPVNQAMALSTSGRQLFIVDASRDLIAVLDHSGPSISRTANVDLGPIEGHETHATVTHDGYLYVATGARVTVVDTITLERVDAWTASSDITAVGAGPDGLYLVTADGVQLVDPSGSPAGTIPSPPVEDVAYVGVVDP